MANQNLFACMAVLVCFLCIVLVVGVQVSWSSTDSVQLDLKFFHATDVQLETDRITPLLLNANESVGTGPFYPLQVETQEKPSILRETTEAQKLHPKRKSQASIAQFKAKKHNKDASSSKNYSCNKHILIWYENRLLKDGTYNCDNCDCHMKITSSINVEDLKQADAVLFFHKAVKPWNDLIR